jgi:hypothetical protein
MTTKSLTTDSEVSIAEGNRSPLHESEALKLLHDHIKSIWTLSAGGLPLVIGFLGYALQHGPEPGVWWNLVLPIVCLLALTSFLVSIHSGILAQRKLLGVLRTSERKLDRHLRRKEGEPQSKDVSNVADSQQAPKPRSAKTEQHEMMDLYDRERKSFYFGAYVVLVAALLFLVISVWSETRSARVLTVGLKNVQVATETQRFLLDDTQVTMAIPRTAASASVEVHDITLNVREVALIKGNVTDKSPASNPPDSGSK